MAVITLGPLVSSLVGSIGGTTFQNTPAGLIARKRPAQRRKYNNFQAHVFSSNQQIINAWQQLTQAQQLSWHSYSQLYSKISPYGRSKKLTGFNWFHSMNYSPLNHGLPLFTTPPAHVATNPLTSLGVAADNTGLYINFTPNPLPANTELILRASKLTKNKTYRPSTIIKQIFTTTGSLPVDNNYATQYLDNTGTDVTTLDYTQNFAIYVEGLLYSFDTGLYSSILSAIWSTNPYDDGIGSMVIGSSFIVR